MNEFQDMEPLFEGVEEQHLKRTIIDQYREAASYVGKLFEVAPDQCYKYNGVGCCIIDTEKAEESIEGPASEEILELMRIRLERVGEEENGVCSYHKESYGCMLGNLKSPLCLSYYCYGELIDTDFSTNDIYDMLSDILKGEASESSDENESIEKNRELVEQVKKYVDERIEEVKVNREEKDNSSSMRLFSEL